MAPVAHAPSGLPRLARRTDPTYGNWRDVNDAQAYIVEGWGEGFMLGALLIMSVITIANMRKRVLLHKMILLELLLAMAHGTFCFMAFKGYGWYLSSTAALLYCSYFTHNVVAWMKIKPFFTGPHASFRPGVCTWVARIYLTTLGLSAPVLLFQIINNFRFFNNLSRLYEEVRPYESLIRDPWWVFSCLTFFHIMRKYYSLKTFKLIRKSPRFGILLAAMVLAITFTVVDVISTVVHGLSVTDGINPYWKLALVFKCLTDNIMLDDFKSVLKRLGADKLDGTITARTRSISMVPQASNIYAEDFPPLETPCPTKDSLSDNSLKDTCLDGLDGHERRKLSMTSSAVGRFGVAIRNLGSLPGVGSTDGGRPPQSRDHRGSVSHPGAQGQLRSQDDMAQSRSIMNDLSAEERRLLS